MIKVFASDLDGTLLQNGNRAVSQQVFTLIKEYTKKGGLFVAASGRQYANLQRLFAPVKDDIAYICENGCLVIYKDEILYHAEMDRTIGEDIIRFIQGRDGDEVVVSGVNTCYIQPKDPLYEDLIVNFVKNNTTVLKDIFQIQEPLFKISVYNKEGIDSKNSIYAKTFGEKVNVVTSGFDWLDMMPSGIHKGSAMEALSRHLKISLSDIMAVGDNYNDEEMLSVVGHPASVNNAKPEIYEMCKYHTDVVETLFSQVISEM